MIIASRKVSSVGRAGPPFGVGLGMFGGMGTDRKRRQPPSSSSFGVSRFEVRQNRRNRANPR